MAVLAPLNISPGFADGKLLPMARQKAEGDRYFVRLDKETKRMLDFLAVDAGAASTEAFGGKLLTEAVHKAWAAFDPKRSQKRAGR